MIFKIDADSHYLDPDVFKYISKQNISRVPSFEFDSDQRLTAVTVNEDPNPFNRNAVPPHGYNEHAGISNLESRLKDFDKLGINFQILNPQELAMRFSYLVERDLAVDMCQSYNRRILEIFNQYPNRFCGPALLALQDPGWSLREIEWCKEVGINSVIIDTCWPDINYLPSYPLVAAPRFEEICAKCEEYDILINVHHAMHQLNYKTVAQFRDFGLHDYFPSTHTICLIGFVSSGILDRYPKLKILFSEGGMGFIDFSYSLLKSKNPDLDINRYFKKNFYFTIETEETEKLLLVLKRFGAERFLFATDYPHDDSGGMNKFNDHINIEDLPISDHEKELICYKNALKLFKLPILDKK
jgi:aminocarboxymuconate-semialdehyde decarboxylase